MAKLLIIDDETKLRETICELFTMTGYEVVEAIDGLDGIEKVKQVKPDLIICDIMMPKLDGYGFIEKLKLSHFAKIPVLFLTAKIELVDHEKGLALGAKEYITKPFSFKELKKIVELHLLQNN
ncbi:response regulator transcription factor [Flavobacterium sp.]|uniref:response regulator transcription factor n=1 Tax=Flavobacterium sp. TaxID=239 RepID=UPI0037B0FBD8